MPNATPIHRLLLIAAVSTMCLISFTNSASAAQSDAGVSGSSLEIQLGTAVHSSTAAALHAVSWAAYLQGVALARTISASVPLSRKSDRLDVAVAVQAEQPVLQLAYHF